MRERDIRETMEQICISKEMQERIIANLQERMEQGSRSVMNQNRKKQGTKNIAESDRAEKRTPGEQNGKNRMKSSKAQNDGVQSDRTGDFEADDNRTENSEAENHRTLKEEAGYYGAKHDRNRHCIASGQKMRNRKRKLPAAAALLLAAGILSIPVQAVVTNLVRERMESISEEELREMGESIQEQEAEADSFSREYTDREKERMRELLQPYQDGTFPERTILQVDHEDEAPEGTLCYVRGRSYFCLPERELTDEELLEIIDFNRTRNYALSQRPAAQEALKEHQEERQRLREQIRDAGGISEEEAVEIAEGLLKEVLGEAAAENAEIHVSYIDISNSGYEHKGDLAYMMLFSNLKEGVIYTCTIDSQDGSVLEAKECRH